MSTNKKRPYHVLNRKLNNLLGLDRASADKKLFYIIRRNRDEIDGEVVDIISEMSSALHHKESWETYKSEHANGFDLRV